ncbi:MAG: hypothetical protein HY011_32850 [Acidobacteria bacterium]|nr:hypothetical protein [Acidobacteriota bacterium]
MEENVAGYLQLDEIQLRVQVSEGKAKHLKETCIWSLWFCEHSNGVNLGVADAIEGERSKLYGIRWNEDGLDNEALKGSYNKDDAVQYGAEAVALLLSMEHTEYNAVERATTGTGVDYWLGHKDRHPNEPFHRASRLEISGIMEENADNKVGRRVNEKLKQTKPTDHLFSVYVVVVEFSQPYATIVLKQ